MRRRRFLYAMAAGAGLTAGCLGSDSEPGRSSPTNTENTPSRTTNAPTTTESPATIPDTSTAVDTSPATDTATTTERSSLSSTTGSGTGARTDPPVRWRTGVDRPVVYPVGVGSDTVYAVMRQRVASGTPSQSEADWSLAALATTDGTERWRRSLPARVVQRPVVHGGSVYVVIGNFRTFAGTDQRLLKFTANGNKQWHTEKIDQTLNLLAVDGDRAYLATNDDALGTRGQRLFAVGTGDGRTRWSVESGDAFVGRVLDGRLLVNLNSTAMAAHDPIDGNKQWQVSAKPLGSQRNDITITDGATFLAKHDEDKTQFISVGLSDGEQRWSYTPGEQPKPVLAGDVVLTGAATEGGTVVGTRYGGHVFALDVADGSERWTFATERDTREPPTLVDGTVYVSDAEGTVYALAASDGTERWRASVDGTVWGIGDSLVPSEDTLVVGTHGGGGTPDDGHERGAVYAFDASDGTQQWMFAREGGLTAPTVADGRAYVGSRAGAVRAFGL